MYSLKIKDKDLYLPKTPYTKEEVENDYLTNDPKRIASYVHRGVAENRLRELSDEDFEIVNTPEMGL